ncbi:MAG TPA: hypothetical protein DIU15_03035 [Deltaproteobacteria bacterium]|nr:hypothetical protein [Deltaproteobacteria bacterium]HCP44985.1 hypothetical protein [Deltaproteobacteria bacterium]
MLHELSPLLSAWTVRSSLALSLLMLAVALGCGCPSGRTGAQNSQFSGSGAASTDPCHRSLDGDLRTIRSRLEKKRVQEARPYVEALAGCPDAGESFEYLMLAAQVYEELGELNAAWTAATSALREAARQGESAVISELQGRLEKFTEHYVRIDGGGPSSLAPRIRYAGAVLDDVTFAQLEVVAENRYVEFAPGQWGFWLYPGRYQVGGVDRVMKAGDSLDVRPGGE